MRKVTSQHTILLFLLALSVLLLNDFYFKATFHNSITGKLSDFTGLLIFPWFWSLIFPKQAKGIYLVTALFFIFWKLQSSTPFINLVNTNLGTSFSRVLDLSDLVALAILPVSYLLFQKSKKNISDLKLGIKVGFSSLAIFAFFATSQPEIFVEPNWDFDNRYTIPLSKKQVLQERMKPRYNNTIPDSLVLNYNKFRLDYFGGKYRFTFNAEILEKDSLSSELVILKLINYSIVGVSNEKKDAISRESFLEIFKSEVIVRIKSTDLPPLVSYSEIQE